MRLRDPHDFPPGRPVRCRRRLGPSAVAAVALVLVAGPGRAQTCEPDPNATGVLSPAPWTLMAQHYNLDRACLTLPYEDVVTVNVPSTVEISGQGTVAIDSLSFATTGAMANVPSGMQYACNPADCVFTPGSPGCIRLYGTPDLSNTVPATRDLVTVAQVTIAGGGGTFPFAFPRDLVDGSHYYLLVRSLEVCTAVPTTTSTTSTTGPGGSATTSTATSTSLPGGTTVTTTTVPVDCRTVPVRDTYPSITCQLATLRLTVDTEPALEGLRDRLRNAIQRAGGHEQASGDLCLSGKTRPAKKRLRRALPPLKQVLRRLRGRAAADVPTLLRDRLMRDVETLQANVRGLAKRLACPDDAAG